MKRFNSIILILLLTVQTGCVFVAADYFKPFGQHQGINEFPTSDFDLSAFNSHKIGVGIRYSPPCNVTRFKGPFAKNKNRVTKLASIDMRYANYGHSDRPEANLISWDVGFKF